MKLLEYFYICRKNTKKSTYFRDMSIQSTYGLPCQQNQHDEAQDAKQN